MLAKVRNFHRRGQHTCVAFTWFCKPQVHGVTHGGDFPICFNWMQVKVRNFHRRGQHARVACTLFSKPHVSLGVDERGSLEGHVPVEILN